MCISAKRGEVLSDGKELSLAICFSTAQKYTEITSYGKKVNDQKEEDTSAALMTREAKLSTGKQEIHSLSCGVVLLKKQTAVSQLIAAYYFAM